MDAAALREDTPLLALLDLRAIASQGFNEGASPLRRVGEAFAKRLAAGRDIRLVAATGLLEPQGAASVLGRSLVEYGQGATPLAIVRGEDVGHALEEWHHRGEALRNKASGERLFDTDAEVLGAYAPAPPPVIQAASSDGARVVLSAFTNPAEAFAERRDTTPTPPQRHPVRVWLIDRYELSACMPLPSEAEARAVVDAIERDAAQAELACEASVAPTRFGEWLVAIHAHAFDRQPLADFAAVAAPLFSRGDGKLVEGSPLWRHVRRIVRPWHTDIAADLLEFGHDLRSAADWLDT